MAPADRRLRPPIDLAAGYTRSMISHARIVDVPDDDRALLRRVDFNGPAGPRDVCTVGGPES